MSEPGRVLEREFMPYLIVKGGLTLSEWMENAEGQRLLVSG